MILMKNNEHAGACVRHGMRDTRCYVHARQSDTDERERATDAQQLL